MHQRHLSNEPRRSNAQYPTMKPNSPEDWASRHDARLDLLERRWETEFTTVIEKLGRVETRLREASLSRAFQRGVICALSVGVLLVALAVTSYWVLHWD